MTLQLALVLLLFLPLAACHRDEQVGTISGPPLLIDRDSASASAPSAMLDASADH
ncbi:hypothetical protein BH09MYX1_BH09MYX1_49430 [soil metagenome]